jgi:hypothetical protein
MADEEFKADAQMEETQGAAPEVEQVLAFEEEVRGDVRKRTSLYDQVRQLNRTQKILLALRGGMESRLILLKMYDPMVYFYLCKNPKITAEEVVEIAKSDLLTPNTTELIGRNKEWMKNERIKFCLAMNRKTPQALALHLLGLLNTRSLKEIARNVGAPPALRRLALKRLQGLPEE